MTVLWCSLWFFVLLPPCVSSARLPTAQPTGTNISGVSWTLPVRLANFAVLLTKLMIFCL